MFNDLYQALIKRSRLTCHKTYKKVMMEICDVRDTSIKPETVAPLIFTAPRATRYRPDVRHIS